VEMPNQRSKDKKLKTISLPKWLHDAIQAEADAQTHGDFTAVIKTKLTELYKDTKKKEEK
jgi:hypothetical protein